MLDIICVLDFEILQSTCGYSSKSSLDLDFLDINRVLDFIILQSYCGIFAESYLDLEHL